jgi:hypothetical protein
MLCPHLRSALATFTRLKQPICRKAQAVVRHISEAFESRFLLKNLSPERNLIHARIRGPNRRDGRPLYDASRPNRIAFPPSGIALAREGRLQRQEAVMKSIIDLGSELLFDRSRVSPYLRLLVTAIGHELARGSPWVSVNKRALAVYEISPYLIAPEPPDPQQRQVA